jgi:predicted nucleotidyltransferase
MDILQQHLSEIEQACVACNVEELYVFGSVLSDKFNAESDLDFVVSIASKDPIEYAEHYFQLKFALERIFNRKIDLLEAKALHSQILQEAINRQKRLIYARRSQTLV